MEAFCFPRIVAHHPYIVLLIVFTFSSICLIIPLTTEKFPDFSDPQMVRRSMILFVGIKGKFYMRDISNGAFIL